MASDTPPARPLRLLVVDDHEVVRQGLVGLLDRRSGFEVVAQAGSVAESIALAARHEPDIVVMDVRLPDGSGIEACREIRAARPETRVVILTSYPDEEAVFSAIVAGASGYLLKQVRGRDLVAALEAVGRGDSLLDPAVTEKVLERVRRVAAGGVADELRRNSTVEVTIRGDEPPGLPIETVVELLSVAREALSNVVRHSGAAHAWVELEQTRGSGMRMTVGDDGRGFVSSEASALGHHGLANMRARAVALGGAFGVESEPGAGARIIVTLPRIANRLTED